MHFYFYGKQLSCCIFNKDSMYSLGLLKDNMLETWLKRTVANCAVRHSSEHKVWGCRRRRLLRDKTKTSTSREDKDRQFVGGDEEDSLSCQEASRPQGWFMVGRPQLCPHKTQIVWQQPRHQLPGSFPRQLLSSTANVTQFSLALLIFITDLLFFKLIIINRIHFLALLNDRIDLN